MSMNETENALAELKAIARASSDIREFQRAVVAGNLMDLSNREGHRFGRIAPFYPEPDDGYLTVRELVAQHQLIRYPTIGGTPELRRQLRSVGHGASHVVIYRGGVPAGAEIEVGDFVTLDRETAELYVGSGDRGPGLVHRKVPVSDVVWGRADYSEWHYSPRSLREAIGDLQSFFRRTKK